MSGSVNGAFTVAYGEGIVNELSTSCLVSEAFDESLLPERLKDMRSAEAIWDTGATGSSISKRVVELCSLRPTGMIRLRYANGMESEEPTYLVNIVLPNSLCIAEVTASLADFGSDVLIGMDIISMGDLAISNFAGQTVMSYRIPSRERIDFVS